MSRGRKMGQVQKVTRADSPGCLAMRNWENKDLTPRVTFSLLAYRWSCVLDPLNFQVADHVV